MREMQVGGRKQRAAMPETEESASLVESSYKENHYVRWDLTAKAKFSNSTTFKAQ